MSADAEARGGAGLGFGIAIKLRTVRLMRRMSQAEAARLSGIGSKSISSFETGERIDAMKLSQLERLLAVYGVSMSEFFSTVFHVEQRPKI